MSSSDSAVRVIGPLDERGVSDYWPKVEPMLAAALERDGWKLRPADLIAQISEGLMGLYVAHDFEKGDVLGAIAAEVQEYPNARVFSIAYCGGHDLYRWAPLIADMEREAVRLGCHVVRIPGRKGWGRVFPDYRETHRVFEREVTR